MESGGAERVVSLLSNEMSKLGHEITILMVSSNIKKSFYKLDSAINLVPLLKTERKDSRFFKRIKTLKKYILESSPDVVVAFLPHICIYTYLALKKTKVPFILSERNDPNQYNFIYKFLLRRSFKKADGCVFQTHNALLWYRKQKEKKTDRIIFNPVNISFVPKNSGIINRKENVLFVGRFDSQKNYNLLLDAFSVFLKKHPSYLLDVYGDGPDRQTFLDRAKTLNINNNIILHGRVLNWQELEFNSGVFVSTSLYEGMPNSLLEAASLSIPCVATDCPIGGSRELSNHFKNILLINTNCSARDFSNKMEEAITMKTTFSGVDEFVGVETISNKWINLIEEVKR